MSKTAIKEALETQLKVASELIKLVSADVQEYIIPFIAKYEAWYTSSLQLVRVFAPDRLAAFRACYDIDPKRKAFDGADYVIQDLVKGVLPGTDPRTGAPLFDVGNVVRLRLNAQRAILASIRSRIDGALADIEATLLASFEDSALRTATQLAKVSPRAAGALAGVVIEDHLQRIAASRQVTIGKKNPTIADLNDPLRQAQIYDTTTWRRIQYLADIRNLCSHKKDREPIKQEVDDLIEGASWLVKTVL